MVRVLEPVPSWITSKETNWPATPLDAALIVLFPASVTFATGAAWESQEIVDASVKATSGL